MNPEAGPSNLGRVFRVCHVLASVGKKGWLEKCVSELANGQAAAGYEVSVVADETMRPHFAEGVDFIPHPMSAGRRNLLNLLSLRRKIVSAKPQIVHAHANKSGMMVRRLRRFLGGAKRVASVQNVRSSHRPFLDYDAVIAASAQIRDSLDDVPSTVIWNGIELPGPEVRKAAAATNPPFLGDDEPVFCAVGRLVPERGMDLLLEAVAQVRGFKLWVIGDGVQRDELIDLVAVNGLAGRVWLAGHRDDAVGLAGCADLFIVASRQEGGPYSLAEALHMEMPCLSTKVGFAPDFLPEEALMEPDSVADLVRGLELALTDLAGLKERQQDAFGLVRREMTLETMIGKVAEVYARVLK